MQDYLLESYSVFFIWTFDDVLQKFIQTIKKFGSFNEGILKILISEHEIWKPNLLLMLTAMVEKLFNLKGRFLETLKL